MRQKFSVILFLILVLFQPMVFSDKLKEAKYYIDKGEKAIQSGDVDELKRCTRQLNLLLPQEEQNKTKLSGISR